MLNLLLILFQTLQSTSLVFYTGGNNRISPKIYSNFLSGFNNVDVYKIPNNYKPQEIRSMFNQLNSKYETIVLVGHSSGCVKAINNCNKAVNKLILLDPVKTPFLDKERNLNHLDDILIINAEKSYKWSIIPPFFPFIPIFRLRINDINIDKTKIRELTVKNYGHCDIIDNPYRNLMHYCRLSVGHPRRKKPYIQAYHRFLHKQIGDFIKSAQKQIGGTYI